MFEGIEKLPLYFLSVFHGIVTAYLVYAFTDIEISDTYFVIFVIFCCIVNIITVRLVAYLCVFLFSTKRGDEKTQELQKMITFDPDTILAKPTVGYFFICVAAGVFSAFWLSVAYQHDWAFNIAKAWNWPKRSSRGILEEYFAVQCNGRANDPNCKIEEYMEVWWKGAATVSVGYISQKPEGYRGRQYVQLSDACELTLVNGEFRYPSQKLDYRDATAFIDVNDPNVLAVQIVPPPNPCEVVHWSPVPETAHPPNLGLGK
jgi:hypothetical protein